LYPIAHHFTLRIISRWCYHILQAFTTTRAITITGAARFATSGNKQVHTLQLISVENAITRGLVQRSVLPKDVGTRGCLRIARLLV
jgi:hypothetical protein